MKYITKSYETVLRKYETWAYVKDLLSLFLTLQFQLFNDCDINVLILRDVMSACRLKLSPVSAQGYPGRCSFSVVKGSFNHAALQRPVRNGEKIMYCDVREKEIIICIAVKTISYDGLCLDFTKKVRFLHNDYSLSVSKN